jgi:hypothetical protein
MFRFARFAAPAVAFALLACASVTRAADTENPEYKSWAGQKPGTTVTYHMVTSAAGTKTEMDRSVKLIEVKPDAAVVEDTIVMVVAGNKNTLPAQKRTIAAKGAAAGAAPNAGAGGADAKETEEAVEIAGKSYKCKVIAAKSEANGAKSESKTWTSTDVPGFVVKMTSNSEGAFKSETTMTLTAIEAGK